ncbi:ADC synthase [Basidiobolus meristosporus CBS 931.73]|uniref:Anthranilate synthase component 2 n=1 Tax=Basidiobolus meristosporus CBS 931.73 TaxID=1314790 RepID=A0A1Y1Y023_9FUNG|nr:ADC synthase [Basidiobolus meristosporus CBS 931.73]|eukprot:ORX91347.1 ADC synthase [Basidiobolus meristosporus CBS 931.73]
MVLQNYSTELRSLRTLIIDNYDSYTFNLLQLWPFTENVVVIRNDQFEWEQFKREVLPHFDNVIISPGPGRPEKDEDFGICRNIIQEASLPIFGVCLGHQGIAHLFGGKVVHAPQVMHGRLSEIYHHQENEENTLFAGIPSPFSAVRYHSLVASPESFPDSILVTAWCGEENEPNAQTIMGLQHRSKPIYGVQFHPESICTEYGKQMVLNFQRITMKWLQQRDAIFPRPEIPRQVLKHSVVSDVMTNWHMSEANPEYTVFAHRMTGLKLNSDLVFESMFARDEVAFWMDSARESDLQSISSFVGSGMENGSFTVRYYTESREIAISKPVDTEGLKKMQVVSKSVLSENTTFWDWASRLTNHFSRVSTKQWTEESTDLPVRLPFDFHCGLVGYFGYELKRESLPGYKTPPQALGRSKDLSQALPDATYIFANKVIAFDHKTDAIWLLCLVHSGPDASSFENLSPGVDMEECHSWMKSTESYLENLAHSSEITGSRQPFETLKKPRSKILPPGFASDLSEAGYIKAITRSIDNIREGETYEVCMTTQFRATLPYPLKTHEDFEGRGSLSESHFTPLDMYKLLRNNNPAPFSACFQFGDTDHTVMSSSPERFLRVSGQGLVEMKPIKGTISRAKEGCFCNPETVKNCSGACIKVEDERRATELENDIKERAENLMIVDLVRNDLNQICVPNSVHVPKLMHIESYETVHQLVTTIRGELRSTINAVDAVRACFPPGSMTGAPKLRTVQILDELEEYRPRGIYSGALGYISLSGAADFSVVIRTAVVENGQNVSVGAGGAITYLSNAEAEYDEVLLKVNSVIPR